MSYLEFKRDRRAEEGRKTQVWAVRSAMHGDPLGTIRWFGRWRQYTFFPEPGTTFNPACLTEISDRCAALTTAHRKR